MLGIGELQTLFKEREVVSFRAQGLLGEQLNGGAELRQSLLFLCRCLMCQDAQLLREHKQVLLLSRKESLGGSIESRL